MKRSYSIFVLALFAASAQAAYYGVLLSRYTDSGFTLPQNWYADQCEIYPDKIVLTHATQTGTSNRTLPFNFPADKIALITAAAAGIVTIEVAPVDGPSSLHSATHVTTNDSGADVATAVDLGGYNGSRGTRSANSAPEAQIIKEFIDLTCNATH